MNHIQRTCTRLRSMANEIREIQEIVERTEQRQGIPLDQRALSQLFSDAAGAVDAAWKTTIEIYRRSKV